MAVVTGAGQGIGRAIALELAKAGHRVALAGRTLAPLEALAAEIAQSGGAVAAVVLDVTREDSVTKGFAEATRRLGPVEILINNAGSAKSAPFLKTDLGLWNEMLAVNLTGTFLCARAAAPAMLEKGWGRIVTIASVAAKHGAPYVSAYTASKHGALGLVRALAAELGSKGVTVNAICPGYVDTPLTQKNIRNIVEKTGMSEADARRRVESMNPGGRLIRPEEIAEKTLWLCSEQAASVNGEAIDL